MRLRPGGAADPQALARAAPARRADPGEQGRGASHTVPVGSLGLEPGVPANAVTLSWPTFSAAAEEAGLSRIYGGIHFDSGNTAGQALGRKVGARAFAKASALWQGAT